MMSVAINANFRLPNDTFYNGGRIVCSFKPLKDVTTQGMTKEECIEDQLERDELVLKYVIKQVGEISIRTLVDYVNDKNACTINIPQDAINIIDCLIKNINKTDYVLLGGKAAYIKEPLKDYENQGFWIYRGFLTSCRPQWKVHRAFFPSGNLADILYNMYRNKMYEASFWPKMAKEIQDLRCEAGHYKKENGMSYKRRHTIRGLSKHSAEEEMIEDLKVSVAMYFDKKYGIKLKYPELPCVKTKDRADYMPMELLEVLPYQTPKADKGDIASALIRCAAVSPQERFNQLKFYVNELVKK
ncbi:unnamed protein product [Dibothriocephalus latus]|uniref:PAZ domain-containing protein n=1 Tax=Dibothriocephalus latus TaxID=60516 RepID=A0A3P7L9P5_DIBLA|nr:unnamed protein product [Dibothriocephalus latus]